MIGVTTMSHFAVMQRQAMPSLPWNYFHSELYNVAMSQRSKVRQSQAPRSSSFRKLITEAVRQTNTAQIIGPDFQDDVIWPRLHNEREFWSHRARIEVSLHRANGPVTTTNHTNRGFSCARTWFKDSVSSFISEMSRLHAWCGKCLRL